MLKVNTREKFSYVNSKTDSTLMLESKICIALTHSSRQSGNFGNNFALNFCIRKAPEAITYSLLLRLLFSGSRCEVLPKKAKSFKQGKN